MRFAINVGICALLSPAWLIGQASATAHATFVQGNTAPPPSCGSTTPNTGVTAASATATCTAGGAAFDARAVVDRGRIAVSTRVTTNAVSPGTPDQLRWQSVANTNWADRLVVTGGVATPDFLSLSLRITGTLSATASRTGVGCGYSFLQDAYTFSGSGGVNDQWNSPANFGAKNDAACFPNVFAAGSAFLPVDFTRTYLMPIVSGRASFNYGLSLRNFLFSDGSVGGSLTLAAANDFENTIAVTGIALRTAGGQDVTDQVTFSFVNGTQLTPSSVVPEPATWALLGSSLVVLGGFRRRRQRRTT